jgi:hypothetical protein
MNPTYFTSLDQEDQLNALYFEGSILANRYEDEFVYLLYSLDSFYVEIRHDAYTNRILEIEAFKSIDRLDPYLPYLAVV